MMGYTLKADVSLLILACSATTLLCTVGSEVLMQLRRIAPLGALQTFPVTFSVDFGDP
jgi:uncharacterized membrane protein